MLKCFICNDILSKSLNVVTEYYDCHYFCENKDCVEYTNIYVKSYIALRYEISLILNNKIYILKSNFFAFNYYPKEFKTKLVETRYYEEIAGIKQVHIFDIRNQYNKYPIHLANRLLRLVNIL